MTEIQQNRWDRLIRRAAGIVGGGSQVNDTLNELFPVIDVERVPGELLALSGFRLGWCSSKLAASVGDQNHHQLFNPVGSQTLVVVTNVSVFANAAQEVRFTNFIGELATLAGNERRRDTRAGTTASIVAQNRTDQSAVSGGLDFRVQILANVNMTIGDDNGVSILFPGTGLTFSTGFSNAISMCSFMWRERVFEPSEVNA